MAKRGNGEGSISRRRNGGWIGQYYAEVGGKRKRRTLYGKNRAMADRNGGLVFDAGKLMVGEYLGRWLRESVKGTVKETTHANYSYITRKHILPAIGHVKIKSLTPAHVRGFYSEKSRTNLSAATVKKMHVVLRKALSQAVSDGLIPRNAADSVKPPRMGTPGEEIKPLDPGECAAFLEAAGEAGERLEALYVLAVHCGLREGELLALRWDEVSLYSEKPALLVRRTFTRGEGGRNWVVGASTKSGRGGACGSPGGRVPPSRSTASASSKNGSVCPGSGRIGTSCSQARPAPRSTPRTCATARSSASRRAPAFGKTCASTISGTPAPRCYSAKASTQRWSLRCSDTTP